MQACELVLTSRFPLTDRHGIKRVPEYSEYSLIIIVNQNISEHETDLHMQNRERER